ncbi:MAG: acyl-CoA dehydrogenase [Propionibacteriales bacterium]|nr:acyl-CoA dehydrogenase [Propionibacteriales bacterium]
MSEGAEERGEGRSRDTTHTTDKPSAAPTGAERRSGRGEAPCEGAEERAADRGGDATHGRPSAASAGGPRRGGHGEALSVDLLYSEVEEQLRGSVRDLLSDRCTADDVLARCDGGGAPYDMDLWRTLAVDLGVAGLSVPEALGGHGASAREVAVVMEELGRRVAPVPFLGSVVLATTALLRGDTGDLRVANLLARLAAGETTGTLVVTLSTPPVAEFPTPVRATPAAEGFAVTGTVGSVADASAADVLVVPAIGDDGEGLYLVDAAADVTVSRLVALDLTRSIATVTFTDAPAHRIAGPGDASTVLRHALTVGAGLLASEQLGIAQWCLDETVHYVGERHQFGRPIGSFQAIKHRLAQLWLGLVSARAAARHAASVLAANDPDTAVAVAVAQSYCATVAVHAAEEAVQLHGGTGMTWEHPAHLYLKRAKSDELALGTPGHHLANLAHLVDIPPPEPDAG